MQTVQYRTFGKQDQVQLQERIIWRVQNIPELLLSQYERDPRSLDGRYIDARVRALAQEQYSAILKVYYRAKQAQIERLETKLDKAIISLHQTLKSVQKQKPGFFSLPRTKTAWQARQSQTAKRLLHLSARKRNINILKTARGNARVWQYATEKSICKLFTSGQLANLSDNGEELANEWSFCTLYPGSQNEKNEQIRKSLQYIKENELIGSVISPEYIARHLSATFIQTQPVGWLRQFYAFLGTQKMLWATPGSPLRYKPFILCANEEIMAPFSPENDVVPRIYLSGGRDKNFPCVHPELLTDEKSRRFFESQLGLTHPDLLAEIELFILPRYRNEEIEATDTGTIYRHLNDFTECFSSFSFQEEKRSAFLQLFQHVPLLPAFNHSGKLSLQPATAVYFDTPVLRSFLQNCPEAYFLDNSLIEKGFIPEKREIFYRFLTMLGVSFHARIKKVERQPGKEIQAKLKLTPKSLRQYDKGAQKITDREIEGFGAFLSSVTPESSRAFADLLSKAIQEQGSFMYRLSLEGEYQYIEKSRQAYTVEKIKETTACTAVFNEKWLFDKDGKKVSVREVQSTEELSDIYDRSYPDLFFFLGIAHDPVLAGLNPAQRKAILIVKELEKKGISIEMLENLAKNPELYLKK